MMNQIRIKHIRFPTKSPSLKEAEEKILQSCTPQTLDSVSWKDFSYKPEVCFRAGWYEGAIIIHFTVREESTKAEYYKPNSPVHKDSCVEFFINPGNDTYFNFEINPIGTVYLGHGTGRSDSSPIPEVEKVETLSSLGTAVFKEKQLESWSLTIRIPLEIFKNTLLINPGGNDFGANFYKCGDELKTPHFISWNPIKTEKPDFHQPEFFGSIFFEPPVNHHSV